jgi:hypothetical protein
LNGHHRRATAEGIVLVRHSGDEGSEILWSVVEIRELGVAPVWR